MRKPAPTFLELRAHPPTRGIAHPDFAARLPTSLIGAKANPAAVLSSLALVVCGAGSVGRRVAQHAARLGVGALLIVDPGRYKAESLLTHAVVPAELGKSKAFATARFCKAISPATRVLMFNGTVQALAAGDLLAAVRGLRADAPSAAPPALRIIGVLATDNLNAEVAAGQLFQHLGAPLFHAAVHGDTLTAQVRCFDDDAGGACAACGFGAEEWRLLNDEARFACDGSGLSAPAPEISTAPTVSTSFLCSTAADLALTLVFRHALGLGAPVVHTLHEWNGYTLRVTRTPLVRNPDCPCEHARLTVLEPPRALAQCSLHELARTARLDGTATTFTVGGHVWIEAEVCGCARPPRPVRQFTRAGGPRPRRCRSCGHPIRPGAFYTHRQVAGGLLDAALREPLGRLGAASAAWVEARAGESAALFLDANPLPRKEAA